MKIVKPVNITRAFEGFSLSLETAEFNGTKVYTLVMRGLTKVIFNGTLTFKSLIKQVPEKANKNQIKIKIYHKGEHPEYKPEDKNAKAGA